MSATLQQAIPENHNEATSSSGRTSPFKNKKLLWIAISALFIAGGGSLLLNPNTVNHLRSPLEPMTARNQVPVDKDVISLGAAATAKPLPAADQHTSDIAALTQRLDKVDANIENIKNLISHFTTGMTELQKTEQAIQSDVAAIKSVQDKAQAAAELAQKNRQAKAALLANRQKTFAAEHPKKNLNSTTPEVLSVDTWNGKPSVAVRNRDDVSVQFMGEGDRSGTYVIKKVDSVNQRVIFTDGTSMMEAHGRTER